MKLTYHCPICNKQLKLKSTINLGSTDRLYEYTCGHVFSKSLEHFDRANLDFTSADGSGKKARPYQEDGIQFILESDFNAVVADQMRLGKTPQALLALKNAYKERTPCLILVRSANLWQWIREYRTWVDLLPNGIFPIVNGTSNLWIPPGFSAYILSMDTFSRPKMQEALKKIHFRLIIADEAHSFKNTQSNRAQALIDFVAFMNIGEETTVLEFKCNRCANEWVETGTRKYDKRIGHTVVSKSCECAKCGQYCYQQQQHSEKEHWQRNPEAAQKITKLLAMAHDVSTTPSERKAFAGKAQELKEQYNISTPADKPCGLILLTGTPILNRAEEYFVPLNLVNPEEFSSLEGFRRSWLEQDYKGRWSRVKRYHTEAFKEKIKPFFIRREKEDVYKELPALNKIFTLIEPDKSLLAEQYNKILDKLDARLAEKVNPSFWDMKEDMIALRQLCGQMKLMWVADYLEECKEESPDTKYAIGIHHQSVRDVLYTKLGGDTNCYKLSGEDSAESKDRIMREWEHSTRQFLIINMLAGGIGMDFHYCDNVLVLERQWNAETERQFEFRFYNPDKGIKQNSLSVEYIIARGTLDEEWYDMVEEKKSNVDPLVYNNWDMTDPRTFRSLLERTVGKRL